MNRAQLEAEFPGFAGQLQSFLLRLTANKQDAEDIVQDTFVRAAEKIDTFRGESSLKTWVFAIGTNLARDRLRSQKRWSEDVLDICKKAALANQPFLQKAMEIRQTSPQGDFEIKEHIAFCFACIGKTLPIEQQLCILLKEIYLFKVAEIAAIIETTEAMVKHHLHQGRSKMTGIFENRCSLVNKTGMCHQCSELNGIFNPKQDTQAELMKLKLVESAGKENKTKLFDLRSQIVRGIDPFKSNAAELQLYHLEHNRLVMEKHLNKN